jgi:hypothetical protein
MEIILWSSFKKLSQQKHPNLAIIKNPTSKKSHTLLNVCTVSTAVIPYCVRHFMKIHASRSFQKEDNKPSDTQILFWLRHTHDTRVAGGTNQTSMWSLLTLNYISHHGNTVSIEAQNIGVKIPYPEGDASDRHLLQHLLRNRSKEISIGLLTGYGATPGR